MKGTSHRCAFFGAPLKDTHSALRGGDDTVFKVPSIVLCAVDVDGPIALCNTGVLLQDVMMESTGIFDALYTLPFTRPPQCLLVKNEHFLHVCW